MKKVERKIFKMYTIKDLQELLNKPFTIKVVKNEEEYYITFIEKLVLEDDEKLEDDENAISFLEKLNKFINEKNVSKIGSSAYAKISELSNEELNEFKHDLCWKVDVIWTKIDDEQPVSVYDFKMMNENEPIFLNSEQSVYQETKIVVGFLLSSLILKETKPDVFKEVLDRRKVKIAQSICAIDEYQNVNEVLEALMP
jgi:hypothetical protein